MIFSFDFLEILIGFHRFTQVEKRGVLLHCRFNYCTRDFFFRQASSVNLLEIQHGSFF
jgi:hypothetical protein